MGDPSLAMVELRLTNEPTPHRYLPMLEFLPEKILVKLFELLDHTSLCRTSRVCRRFQQIISTNDSIWKNLCLQRGIVEAEKPEKKSWRWMAIATLRVWKVSDHKEGPGTMYFDSFLKNPDKTVTKVDSGKDKYVGDWSQNQRNGFGMFIWSCNSKGRRSSYIGNWKNDLREGYGVRIWPEGNRYVGDYHHHYRHGNGVFAFADGSLYQGKLVNNQFTVGTYRWPNGRLYRGEWKGVYRNGKGQYQWPDGRTYDGDWKEDKRHGNGTYTWPDGDSFEGTFVVGKRAGPGKLICKNGEIYEQFWKEKIFDEFAKGKESNSEVTSTLLPSDPKKDVKMEEKEDDSFKKPREPKKDESSKEIGIKRTKEENEEEDMVSKKRLQLEHEK